MVRRTAVLIGAFLLASAAPAPRYDLVIRGGTIYDGTGAPGLVADVAVQGDRIVAIGSVPDEGRREIDAKGHAVAPGFINMLSWANESLIADGRGLSDIEQGVTLEVMGEGWSMGPLTPEMKKREIERQSDVRFPVEWTTLGEYLGHLQARGVSPNVASFVGAATVRIHELGEGDVDPTPGQLARMRALVRQAMDEGAMGVGSSLIYAPGFFAETPELTALATESARCGGMYISHMRNESDHIEQAIDELIAIARGSGGPAEIHHLKLAGRANWGKLDRVIAKVEAARRAGIRISANMYTYTAGATGLTAAMPPWVQDGGLEKWIERLKDPANRARVAAEMRRPGQGWENLLYQAGSPDNVLLIAFKNPALKKYTGRTLASVAKERGKSVEETAMDLVIEDGSRVGTAYFLMDEANVRRQTGLPWMSFGSDEEASADEGVFRAYNQHPRAYGNFARFLGRYARDERTATLPDAVRRLSGLPASNLGLKDRGLLKVGHHADIVVFDPARVMDHATFDKPRRYATGVRDVFVNGVQVLKDGAHTGAKPGRFVKGPGAGRCPPA